MADCHWHIGQYIPSISVCIVLTVPYACKVRTLAKPVQYAIADGCTTAQLAPAFVGMDSSDTTWSETMFLYCNTIYYVVFF